MSGLRDLVAANCEGTNPLVELARHFSSDQSKNGMRPLAPEAARQAVGVLCCAFDVMIAVIPGTVTAASWGASRGLNRPVYLTETILVQF